MLDRERWRVERARAQQNLTPAQQWRVEKARALRNLEKCDCGKVKFDPDEPRDDDLGD